MKIHSIAPAPHGPHSVRASVLIVAAGFATPAAHATLSSLDGGGGSAAVYTLSPAAAALHGVGPGDLLVDDATDDGMLTVGIPAAALGLPPGADILGLSGGRDNGLPTMIEVGNAMNWPHLLYQHSVNPTAVDDFTSGGLVIPFELPVFFPVIAHTIDYSDQFALGEQEGDVFFNREIPEPPPPPPPTLPSARFNGVTMDEGLLELFADDDMDDFDSVQGLGGGPDVLAPLGMLDPGVRVYFTLAGGGPIFFKDSTTPPGAPPTIFAAPGMLGVPPGVVIDAIAVWDVGLIGVFEGMDRVVWSPAAAPAGLPIVIPGDPYSVPIDQGGCVLVGAFPPFPDWISALPGNYFSLSYGDELDGLMALDPREFGHYCMGPLQRPVLDARSLVLSQWLFEMAPGGTAYPWVSINDSTWLPAGVVDSYNVQVTIDAPVAVVTGAGSLGICGPGPCCGGCWSGSAPACPSGVAGAFYACGLAPMGLTFADWNECIGSFSLLALAPGEATLTLTGSVTIATVGGPVTVPLVPCTARIHVITDCDGNGRDDTLDIGKGFASDCNQNGVPDTCDWPGGFPDCNGNGNPDPCDLLTGTSADCNQNGVPDECDLTATLGFTASGYAYAGSELALGDLDGDGDVDLAASNDSGLDLTIRRNNGSGALGTPETTFLGAIQSGLVVVDLDGDGDRDIALAHQQLDVVSVLRNNGAGVFSLWGTLPVGSAPYGIATADLDGDGDRDLVTSNIASDNVSVLLNAGNATFAAAISAAVGDGPIQVEAADLDGDGDRDVVTANRFDDTVTVLRNNGNATFAAPLTYAVGSGPRSLLVAELGGAAGLEVIVSNDGAGNVQVLESVTATGSIRWTWTAPPGGGGGRLAAGDFDLDGDLDLAVANYGAVALRILRLNSDGSLGTPATVTVISNASGVTAGNLNADARIDLATSGSPGLAVLLNQSTTQVSYDCNGNSMPDECEAGASTYCTAKVNSQGCTPAIGAIGIAGATCPGPFRITATNVVSNKAGLLFYGFTPAATPFQGSFLCISSPIRRTAVQNSGGMFPPNNCTGTFDYDFNALIRSGTIPGLVAGATVRCQWWYRDPQAAFGTGLSNAASFLIGP